MKLLAALLLTFASLLSLGQQPPSAIVADPPEDKANPARMEAFVLPSHGANLNAILYTAEGPGPHPNVILLHGFPGNEKNLDLAQSIRRAGWNVLFFNYRGSWGSPGTFSFNNSIEDTLAAIDFLRDPANAKKYGGDPTKIVLIGHSMGGFMASAAGARDSKVVAIGMIAAWNIGADAKRSAKDPVRRKKDLADDMHPLAGCTPDSLFAEMTAHASDWDYNTFVPQLKNRPVLVISTNDGLRPANESFVDAMKTAGAKQVEYQHIPTDHGFNDHRIALQSAVLEWLQRLTP